MSVIKGSEVYIHESGIAVYESINVNNTVEEARGIVFQRSDIPGGAVIC